MNNFINLAILCICLDFSLALPATHEWELYKFKYGKEYDEKEDITRYNLFMLNKQVIDEHNKHFENGRVSYSQAINQFTDMMEDELKGHVMNISGLELVEYDVKNVHKSSIMSVPQTVDWRYHGVVTPVKDQGQCGSCWAFSTTGALESQHAIKTGQLVSLSEQNLLDCETDVMKPCTAGWPTNAFVFINDNGGIDTETSYPYAGKGGSCKFNKNTVGATDTGYVWVDRDENSVMKAVSEVGPLSVCITASQSFHNYHQGIFEGPCSNLTKDMDHCVLLVGYGTENNMDYWLVKNSWGSSWGDNGYIKIRRNYNNLCGIANYPSYPTL